MEQQHPAEPVDALIEFALVLHAFHQRKVGEVPHAPETCGRAKKMQTQEGCRREDSADRADEGSRHAAGFGKEDRDHGENVHGEIQCPDRERDVVAPVERLADVVAVVDQHGDDHDDPAEAYFIYQLVS